VIHLTKCVHVAFAERLDVQIDCRCCAITALRQRAATDRVHFGGIKKSPMKYGLFATAATRCECRTSNESRPNARRVSH
jgi:hypothetical protein